MHYGVTSNAGLLVNVPLGVVTVTGPVNPATFSVTWVEAITMM